FGGAAAVAPGHFARLFASPGPIFEPEGRRGNFWRLARALHAAGFRGGDIVHNTFAYHLTPGGPMMESAARALGCAVIPAGPGNTELQLDAIAQYRPNAFCGVPDFLKILLDQAAEAGRDASSIRKAMVSGAALPASLRAELGARGVAVLQCYAAADLGLIAYESAVDGAPCPGMTVDEDILVEIVRPGTGDPVPDGEVGEVVATLFALDWPLVRFATGDLSKTLPGPSPCGRTAMRLAGWLGRADQTAKVRGMFVRPEQVAAILARHREVARARLVVGRAGEQDTVELRCEAPATGDAASTLAAALAESLRELTKLRGTVAIVTPSSLPNDGKVIEDTRPVG
ncbi:MAG: phenylacetate--CoA ligase, partial [Alphaproteobacteria bacterium]|nr:phenylacetate--CoA ligase [Alphaproteobacteria bacterium]